VVRVSLINIENYALHGITVEFSPREISAIVGPNGAGKTTILRVIAGLTQYKGSVLFDGKVVDSIPPYRRNVLYIPQRNALFPHMNVWENIAFPLKIRGFNRRVIEERVNWALKKLSIEHLASKYPSQLSSGEARRVAIARSLVVEGDPLLVDEIEQSLDIGIRLEIYEEIERISRERGLTTIIVTHDLEWAMSRADKIVFLWGGRSIYAGSPKDFEPHSVDPSKLAWFGSVVDTSGVDENECYAIIGDEKAPLQPCNASRGVDKAYIPPDGALVDQKGRLKGRVVWSGEINGVKRLVVDVNGALVVARYNPQRVAGSEVNIRILKAVPIKT
jgi:ABC-type Fe3+/spermidine/putrescine transport system ATPase subunit